MMSRRRNQQNGHGPGGWTTFSYRFSVQGRTGSRHSRQGLPVQLRQVLPELARDSIVNHLSFLSCRPLSALARGLESHSYWNRRGISSSLISWPPPSLLWRQPQFVLSHSSRLRTARGEPPQTPPVGAAVVRRVLGECQ